MLLNGLMVRASDWHSEGFGFESQLDPGFFSVDSFLTLSVRVAVPKCISVHYNYY